MLRPLSFGLMLVGSIGTAWAADPTGDWRVKEGVANVRIADCDGHLWGVISWEMKPGGVDAKNPDASKKMRPTLGMPVLLDMVRTKPGKDEWKGEIYNAKNGKTYESTISMPTPDQLEVKGCVIGFLCGGEIWTRPPAGPGIVLPTTAALPPMGNMSRMSPAPRTPPKKMVGQKASGKNAAKGGAPTPDDPIGDICSLPDVVAGAPH